MTDYDWDPDTYLGLMAEEVPHYERVQQELVAATANLRPRTILELGVGSGETAKRVLAAHPEARLTGVDESAPMLEAARVALPGSEMVEGRLEDELPAGPWDLVVSMRRHVLARELGLPRSTC